MKWNRHVSHNGWAFLSQGRKYGKFLSGSWAVSPPHVCGDWIIHSEMRCGVLLFWSHDTANLLIPQQCTKTILSVRLQSHLPSLVGCCCEMKSIKRQCAWSRKAFSKHTSGFVTEVWIWFKWCTFKLLCRRQVCVCVHEKNKNEWSLKEILFPQDHNSIQVNMESLNRPSLGNRVGTEQWNVKISSHLEIIPHHHHHHLLSFCTECTRDQVMQ